ncbi:MAG: hypothetical protein AAGI17_10085 [Planctomycetota bacterium]
MARSRLISVGLAVIAVVLSASFLLSRLRQPSDSTYRSDSSRPANVTTGPAASNPPSPAPEQQTEPGRLLAFGQTRDFTDEMAEEVAFRLTSVADAGAAAAASGQDDDSLGLLTISVASLQLQTEESMSAHAREALADGLLECMSRGHPQTRLIAMQASYNCDLLKPESTGYMMLRQLEEDPDESIRSAASAMLGRINEVEAYLKKKSLEERE